jgi:hypothetical protein
MEKKLRKIILASIVLFLCSSCFAENDHWTPNTVSEFSDGYYNAAPGSDRDSAATWSVKNNDTVVMGRHICATSGYFTSAPLTEEDGPADEKESIYERRQYCHCQRLNVGGAPDKGSWIFHSDRQTAAWCVRHCARECADSVINGVSAFRIAVMTLPLVD